MSPDLETLRPAIGAICGRHRVRRLDLFGSATNRQLFDPARSDIDFLVEFDALPAGTYANHYFGLLEELTQLLGRPVDLIVERAIQNPYFKQSLQTSRQLLYAA